MPLRCRALNPWKFTGQITTKQLSERKEQAEMLMQSVLREAFITN